MTHKQFNFIKQWCNYICDTYTNLSNDVALFISCQFALESNFGESELATNYNNITGMRRALVRPSTCREIKGSYFAAYSSLVDCVADYFLCLAFHRLEHCDLCSVKAFIPAINKWYCLEKDYIHKITQIYNNFKSFKND